MSNKHTNLISQLDGLTTAQAFVLYRLADYANPEGQCFPGVPRLAHDTRLTDRWVRLVLHQLEKRNLISRAKGTYATHFRTIYTLTYADLFVLDPVVQPPTNGHKPAALVAPPPETDPHRALHPEPLTPEQIEERRAKMREAMARLSASKTMEKGKRNGKAPNL